MLKAYEMTGKSLIDDRKIQLNLLYKLNRLMMLRL